jgi:uncharacterized protein YcnI
VITPRSMIATLKKTSAAALVSVICMLAFAPPASARVTVVPGSVRGGGTETFTVRLSNEQPDLTTTRLEITFPPDFVIPFVQVAPAGGWDVKVTMRRVVPPVTVDGKEIDEAVASIVWTGGEVGPKQFEQFRVTAGPLPADGGRLVLAAAQSYDDGTVDRWSEPAQPGWPGAPMIVIAPHPDVAPAGRPVPVAAAADPRTPAVGVSVLPWILLVAGLLMAGVGSFIGYRQQEQRKRAARRRRMVRAAIATLPRTAGRR